MVCYSKYFHLLKFVTDQNPRGLCDYNNGTIAWSLFTGFDP